MEKPKMPKIDLKLNYEFSKREKVLLYALGMVALLMFALYIIIFPNLSKYEELSTKLADTEYKVQEMQLAIDTLAANRTMKANAEADLAAQKATFSRVLTNDELDTLITNMVVDNGFKAQDLSISNNTITELKGYGSDAAAGDGSTTEEGGSTEDLNTTEGSTTTTDDTASTTAKEATGGIQVGTVTMTITGTNNQLEGLLDSVNANGAVRITNFSEAPGTANSSSNTKTAQNILSGTNTVNVTFEVYMTP